MRTFMVIILAAATCAPTVLGGDLIDEIPNELIEGVDVWHALS